VDLTAEGRCRLAVCHVVATLREQLDAAWQATGVSGTVRGMTTLADVVGTDKSSLREALGNLQVAASVGQRDAEHLADLVPRGEAALRILGAGKWEPLDDAAARVVRERDEARADRSERYRDRKAFAIEYLGSTEDETFDAFQTRLASERAAASAEIERLQAIRTEQADKLRRQLARIHELEVEREEWNVGDSALTDRLTDALARASQAEAEVARLQAERDAARAQATAPPQPPPHPPCGEAQVQAQAQPIRLSRVDGKPWPLACLEAEGEVRGLRLALDSALRALAGGGR
jgi:hypothetical protein